MKKLLCIIFAAAMLISALPFSAFAEDELLIAPKTEESASVEISPAVSAECAILVEQTTGTVLFAKNADKAVPIASVTKIMTLLLAVEAIDSGIVSLDDEVIVSEKSASMGGSQMYLEVGEKISVRDLLKAVFVASANDGAVALAEFIAGSVDSFVARMNSRAKELGMDSAVFYNPTGLDDSEVNLLSARDVAKMSNALLAHEIIYQFTKIWTDSVRNGAFGLANTNKLIRFYPGATGLKTGSTGKAKYCLSASAERNGLKLCAVILGAPTTKDRFSDAKALLDSGFANFAFYVPENFQKAQIKVWGGKLPYVSVDAEVKGMLVDKRDSVGIETKVVLQESLEAPVEKGQNVGSVIFQKSGVVLKEIPIFAVEKVEKKSVFDIFGTLLRLFFLKES